MIRPLRKRHLLTWILLAILLPIGFIAAFWTIPKEQSISQELQFGAPEAFSTLLQANETDDLKVQLRENPANQLKQVEIEVKQPLGRTSALVYLANSNIQKTEEGQLLNQLGSVGMYRIELDSALSAQTTFHFLFYDKIKEEVFDKIQLSL